MSLPQLRKTIKIKFLSLRNGVGQNFGVILDIDTFVERKAYRIKTDDGSWRWQIKGLKKLMKWDYFANTDQEIMDEYGPELDVEIIQ